MVLTRVFFVFIITFSILLTPVLVRAQNGNQDRNIAVVDIEKVLNESKAGKSIQAQLKKHREVFQKEFSDRENKLVAAEKILVQQRTDLSPEEFAKKRKAFEKQLLETRNLFQKRRNSLDKGLGGSLSNLRKNIIEVTAAVADENKYQVVLTRDSVVIVQKEMDITGEVLSRLNKKISTIKLNVSE
jgi:Skp family chaperone for outer membrane proteins